MQKFLMIAAGFLTLGWSQVEATSGPAPDRPVSWEERLANTLSDSPLVVVGRMLSVYDTTVGDAEFSLTSMTVVTFEPLRVLKGRAHRRTFRFVLWKSGVNSTADRPGARGPTHDVRGDRQVLLCFDDLHASPRAPAASALGAGQGIARWAASESESPYSVPRLFDWTTSFERQVRAEIARQSPAGLARGSSRVVLARAPAHTFPGAHAWTVERTIKGPATKTVSVRVVVPSDTDPSPRALLFLRKVGGVYEPTRLGAGIVPVRGDRVPSWNCSLEAALARVTR